MRDVVPAVCADRLQQPVWPAHIYAQSAPRAANPKMNQDEDHARLNSHAIDRARVVHRVITSLIEEHRCTRSNPAGRVAACAHARGPHVRAAVVSYDGLPAAQHPARRTSPRDRTAVCHSIRSGATAGLGAAHYYERRERMSTVTDRSSISHARVTTRHERSWFASSLANASSHPCQVITGRCWDVRRLPPRPLRC